MKDALARLVVVLVTLVAISILTACGGETVSPTLFDERDRPDNEIGQDAEIGQPQSESVSGPIPEVTTVAAEDEEIVILQRLAEQGDAWAQDRLGDMYRFGRGVPEDHAQAVKWYRKAAEQDNPWAQDSLGDMYRFGRGVPQDDAQAVKWYRKAAEQDNPWAQANLGDMYRFGRGVSEDYVEAVKWYRRAAEQDNAWAQASLGDMYRFGRGVPEDHVEAVRWYRLAAGQDNAGAQNGLGNMYRFGEGVPQDDAEAVRWYRLAAEQGYPFAQENLGDMYRFGDGVPRDDAEALRWYRLAAEQGGTKETWRCFASTDHRKATVLFTLVRVRSGDMEIFGEVSVAGVSHLAGFKVSGLDRRWNFGHDYQYAFIIKPDGTGLYYDFSTSGDGSAKPSDFFRCQQRDY